MLSSRRSACDKCRDQKLRCLRDPDQQRCHRCIRADAECTINPSFRMRNYTGNPTAKRRSRDSMNVLEDADEPLTDSVLEGPEGFEEYNHPETPANAMSLNKFGTSPAGGQNESSIGHVGSAASTLMLNTDFGMSTTPFNSPLPIPDRLEKWHQNNASLFNFTIFPAASSSATAERSEEAVPNANSMDFEPSAAPNFMFSSGQMMHSADVSLLDGTWSDKVAENGFSMSLENEELFQSVAESILQDTNLPIDEVQHNPTQKLQQVQATLSELAAYVQSFPSPPSDQVVSGACKPSKLVTGPTKAVMENIVQTTGEFLMVLESIANSQKSRTASTTSSPADSHTSPTSDPATSRESGPSSSIDNLSVPSISPTSRSVPFATRKPDIDITLLLLILACYIQVLRLFVALVSHIHDYLEKVAERDNPTLQPVPGLSFGSLPIYSGNLQTTIFIELIISLFGRMENILGIPRDLSLSVGGREARDHNGMFRDRHFVTLLEIAMRKEETALAEMGRVGLNKKGLGGIKALQVGVRGTQQLLKDRINP